MDTLNPFTGYITDLTSKFYYTDAAQSFYIQLYLLSGILGFLLLVNLISLAIRIRNSDTTWLFRLRSPQNAGKYQFVTPNSTMWWLIWFSIYLALLEGFIYTSKNRAEPGSDLTGAMMWRCVPWIPIWIAGWFMCWSISIAPLLVRPPNYSDRFDLSRYPVFINTFFISMPFIFVSILLPFAWKLSKTTDASFQLYQLTVSLLQAQSDRVNNGLVPDPLALKEIQDNSLTMGETVYTIASQFRVIWIIQNAFCIVLSIILFTAVISQLRALSAGINKLRIKATSLNDEYQDHKLKSAYRSLAFTSICACVLCVGYELVGIVLIFRTLEIVKMGALSQIILFSVLYIAAIVGGVITITIFIRSFNSSTNSHKSTTTNMSKVTDTRSLFTFRREIETVSFHPAKEFELEFNGNSGKKDQPFAGGEWMVDHERSMNY